MSIKSKDITKLQAENLWGRLSEDVKEKIISEVKSGMHSKRAAGRKYGLPLSTIENWLENIISYLGTFEHL
jgi:transposase